MEDIERPGANVALAALRIASVLDREDLTLAYSTHRWNEETQEYEPVEPYFVAYLNCSDTFFWGSSDAEEVTEENLHILEEVIAELKPRYDEAEQRRRGPEGEAQKARLHDAYEKFIANGGVSTDWSKDPEFKAIRQDDIHPYRFAPVGDLFAARVRKMRPQGAAYKVRYDESIWPLFDACGPVREVGFGNPKEPGQ